ncbi:MAG: hypothetical protein E6K12_00475 [Methanobacteriota archaeon]|nr:MAG: hypothetical protein E6K15_02325 [Euryarchaeota archaeon]TLZ68733.1 MAG: hypothetical protein E6K12_00475 [Euryarchaeota archaeon]
MAIAFSALDRQLTRDIRQLHDYLWDPTWNGHESKLQTSLVKGARSLDTFLHAGGRLRKNAESLAKPWNRERQGSSLFELLDDAVGLTAATELVRTGKYREAVMRAQAVVESTSIGVCSDAGHFEIVEEWEARKIDFHTYTGRMAAVLESKLIPQATQFRRVLNAVHNFGSEWDGSASKDEQRLAARSAVENGAWCVSRSVGIRTLLGTPPKVSEKDFGVILNLIVNRL